jgi:hypothetical protein
VYSKDGSLDSETARIGREVIGSAKEEAGGPTVISHTAAQLIYLNELLEKDGIPRRFAVDAGITEPGKFEETNALLQRFLWENMALGNDVRRLIMGFKNCPGPMFGQLV